MAHSIQNRKLRFLEDTRKARLSIDAKKAVNWYVAVTRYRAGKKPRLVKVVVAPDIFAEFKVRPKWRYILSSVVFGEGATIEVGVQGA